MKKIMFNILYTIYTFCAVFVLCSAILFPFSIRMKDFESWPGYIIYPLAIIIIATQENVLKYFQNKTN